MSQYILNEASILDMGLQGVKLIEASAGTGKTFAIGNLYVRMILDGKAVEEILVVTFTRAATDELRGRIRRRIHAALQYLDKQDGEDALLAQWLDKADADAVEQARLRLKLAVTGMDAAAIYTIHAFCQKMLMEHAFYSGQSFDVDMLTDDSALWEAALKDWWRKQIGSMSEPEFAMLERAFSGLDGLIQLQTPLRQPLVKLLPEVEGDVAKLIESCVQAKEKLAARWDAKRDDILGFLESGALSGRSYQADKMPLWCVEVDDYLASWHVPEPACLTKFQLSTIHKALKKNQTLPEDLEAVFEAFEDYNTNLRAAAKQSKNAWLHQAHQFAVEQVQGIKQNAGQLAFNDQLVRLHDAMVQSSELRDAIRTRFPMAMIDEFQDTDAIQYGIFKALYHQQKDCLLLMIGDPKQAIYAFRGGDIFTYMRAKQDADTHYTLTTNWRSTKQVVAAVNHLFARQKAPFMYENIAFSPVEASKKEKPELRLNGQAVDAMTLWHMPLKEDGKPLNKIDGSALIHAHVAHEVAALLQQAGQGALMLGDKPVKPGDIAVLTLGHQQAAAVRDALKSYGVAAVTAGKEHVFHSDAAEGLFVLLRAVVEPGDRQVLREALSSSLLVLDYAEIHDIGTQQERQLQWQQHFMDLHHLWEKHGFMLMFQSLLRRLHVGEALAKQGDGERQLTNVLHLGELLQQEAQTRAGMTSLLAWFAEQRLDSKERSDDTQMRLESDGDLVQISTVHAAKGLEYPIVFVPYLWGCKPRQMKSDRLLNYYDEAANQHCLTLDASKEVLEQAEKERLAEDMRLLYVALTRASHKVYLAWGSIGRDACKSALAYLLYAREEKAPSAGACQQAIPDDVMQDSIELNTLGLAKPEAFVLAQTNQQYEGLHLKTLASELPQAQWMSSFTRLTRHIHPPMPKREKPEEVDAVFALPAGRRMGVCVHALLEQLDFQADVPQQVADWLDTHAVRYGITDEHIPTMQAWMDSLLQAPLQGDLSLKDIALSQRLNELHFDFAAPNVSVKHLNKVLQDACEKPLQPLSGEDCRGYLTGEMDLVFMHGGRYYIADYKSNHLGYALADYQAGALHDAIMQHRYDVQYLIYTVALHRYLRWRLPDYDYEQHIGGVYYLFLRGMRAGHTGGVFFHKPDAALIETLDQEVFRQGVSL